MLSTSTQLDQKLDNIDDIEIFVRKFNEYDSITKLQMLKKLRKIVAPNSSHLMESEVKSTMQSHPHMKIDTSTRHEPSTFKILSSV